MNNQIKFFLISLVIIISGFILVHFVGNIDRDILQSWAKYIGITWLVLFIATILISGLGKNNSLQQVIEWKPSLSGNTDIFYRWNGNLTNEIKNSSKLIIAPAQGALIINDGQIVDLLTQEGIYPLKTSNIPFITNLIKVAQSGESEHKVYIYFFKISEIANIKRGTAQPIVYQDPFYQFPLRFGVFGNYSIKIQDIKGFFMNYVHQKTSYTLNDMEKLLLSRTITTLSSVIPSFGYSYFELDSKRGELVSKSQSSLNEDMTSLGLELLDFRIDGLQFDLKTQSYINTVATATAEAKAGQEGGVSYTEYQQLGAMRDAAQNENGSAGLIAGMGIGANVMAGVGNNISTTTLMSTNNDIEHQLQKLISLKDKGLITEEDFENKKKELLAKI